MNITVIGAGNGGQALAGFLGMTGNNVVLYNRSIDKLQPIIDNKGIFLKGAIQGFGKVRLVTNQIELALKDSEIIMIATTADAHKNIAELMFPYLEDDQIIILNPGRTGGALELKNKFVSLNLKKNIYIGEAQSLVFACRKEEEGVVNIIGKKNLVMFAAYPAVHTGYVIERINKLFDCFVPVENILVTGLENIGAIFHPSVVLFNAASIERNNTFYFYQDMTPTIASFLQKLDEERLNVGKAFGISLMPVEDWVMAAYSESLQGTLCEKMQKNPAYNNILAPKSIDCRLITEDIPTGLLPISELGAIVGVKCPLMKSVITISQALLNRDFYKTGRSLVNLGLSNMTKEEILKIL